MNGVTMAAVAASDAVSPRALGAGRGGSGRGEVRGRGGGGVRPDLYRVVMQSARHSANLLPALNFMPHCRSALLHLPPRRAVEQGLVIA